MEWRDRGVIISSSTLKKLKIISVDGSLGTLVQVLFDSPNLVFFDYSDVVARDYSLVNLQNLEEVGLNILLTLDRYYQARDNVWKLIHGIRNAKILHLTPSTFEVLSRCCEDIPVLRNLTVLNVRSVMIQGWEAMPRLLRNCPNLETLYLGGLLHIVTEECGDVCVYISKKKKKGRSLRSFPVKKIQIQGFRGTIQETHMIKHFLDYRPNLKELEIIAEEKEPTLFEIPNWSLLVEDTLMQINEMSSCNVIFRVHADLYHWWTGK